MSSASADPTNFIDAAVEGLRQQTAAHSATWRLGQGESWAADLDAGTIVFSFTDGTTVSAEIQVVGTYNTVDGTFLWGWDHPSIPENLREHALLAKQWGEENDVAEFTMRKVECSEDEAWRFAAVANRLGNANGAYRGPAETALVFMTFGKVTITKTN